LLCRRVHGANHSETLTIRSNIASWTGKYGRRAEALRLFRELLPDQERVLGRDHPDTLAICHDIQRLDTPNTNPDS
jgi:Tetratricopeptide repeat